MVPCAKFERPPARRVLRIDTTRLTIEPVAGRGEATHRRVNKKLAIFPLLTLALSAVLHVLIARAGTMQARGQPSVAGLMWSPGVAALLAQFLIEGNLRELGWRWGKTRYQLLSVGLPVLAVLVTDGVVWLAGLGGLPGPAFIEEVAGRIEVAAS